MSISDFFFKNTELRQTIAKNFFWVFVSQTGGRLIRAIIVIYAARVIGAEGYGIFSYALSLAAIFTIVSDFGIDTATFKQASQNREKISAYFSSGFVIKTLLALVGVALVIFVGPHISNIKAANSLLPFVALIIVFDNFREFTFSFNRAQQKMELEAGINLVTNIGVLVFGMILMVIAPTPFHLALGYTIGTGLGTFLAFFTLRHNFRTLVRSFSSTVSRELLDVAWPLAFVGILGTLMINTDTILLGFWRTASEIGYYSAAQRPVTIIYGFMGILPPVIFPAIVSIVESNKEKFRAIVKKALQTLSLIGFPIAVGGTIAANGLMLLLYGTEYAPSTPSFQLLLLGLFANFVTLTLNYVLLAHHKQKNLMWITLAGFIGNAIFDILFIPLWGGPGSALATLLNQSFVAIFMWKIMDELIGKLHLFVTLKRIVVASLVMGVVTFLLLSLGAHTIITVTLSALFYFVLLFVMQEPLLEELKIIFRHFRSRGAV